MQTIFQLIQSGSQTLGIHALQLGHQNLLPIDLDHLTQQIGASMGRQLGLELLQFALQRAGPIHELTDLGRYGELVALDQGGSLIDLLTELVHVVDC